MISSNNSVAFKALLEQKVQDAIGILTQKVYDQLMIFIQEDVYDTYDPSTYIRTYDFKDEAWQQSFFKIAGEIVGEISYIGSAMRLGVPQIYTHGNMDIGEDRRARLAEILNRGYWDSEGWDFGRYPIPKPFFDDTLEWIEQNWNQLVKDAFLQVGLKIM